MTSVRAGRRALRPLLALVAVGSLGLAGCSGDEADGAVGVAGTRQQGVAAGTTMSALSPLTGLKLGGEAAVRPVLAVKVDNSRSSAPQVGLGEADLVVEELVEGGITRLAAFFHSSAPRTVGPVRSIRATDIGIVQPLGATLVASGGAPTTVRRVREAEITTVTEGGTGFFRDSTRSAPYNLFIDLEELAGTLDPAELPEPYLPFGPDGLPEGVRARAVTATFSGASSSTFEFRGGRYVNVDSNGGAGDRFIPDTVLVLRVRVTDAGYRDPAGNPVPETTFTGSGAALIFSGGRLVRGTWTKDGFDGPVRLQGKSGALELPPGRVWIELVPVRGGDVSFRR